jgi:hypothetical protein
MKLHGQVADISLSLTGLTDYRLGSPGLLDSSEEGLQGTFQLLHNVS